MDKKHKIIKEDVQDCYDKLEFWEKRLQELREQCDHPETEYCTYSPRPGQYYENTKICSVCGAVISFSLVNENELDETQQSP
jgi:hypothetical protein